MADEADPRGNKVQLPGTERRRAVRHSCKMETSCHLLALVEGDPWPGWVRNISVGGISLVLSRRLDTGTLLAVRLKSLTEGFQEELPVRVLYAVEEPGGDWITGCAFMKELTTEQIDSLLS